MEENILVEEGRREAFAAGMDYCISKPVREEELLGVMSELA